MIGTTNAINSIGSLPNYTYTGNHQFIDDGAAGWRIKFTSNGTLHINNYRLSIDVFLVGGGGGGSAGGGGGGYTKTYRNFIINGGVDYVITIGAGGAGKNDNGMASTGGTSSAFGYSASGGHGGDGGSGHGKGGNGGSGGGGYSGGAGGTDGSAGSKGSSYAGGAGQGTTTREFAETGATLYSSGAAGNTTYYPPANTGNGGGKNCTGASGIIIIRNARQ